MSGYDAPACPECGSILVRPIGQPDAPLRCINDPCTYREDWVKDGKERCEAATKPEHWQVRILAEGKVQCLDGELKPGFSVALVPMSLVECDDDADFIAHARTDLPRALACIEAADALVAAYDRLRVAQRAMRGEGSMLDLMDELGKASDAHNAALAAYQKARKGEP